MKQMDTHNLAYLKIRKVEIRKPRWNQLYHHGLTQWAVEWVINCLRDTVIHPAVLGTRIKRRTWRIG